ncbi:MAG: hypothetical protein FWC43_06680 [Planctomycetaceae bacterium]|nr:hypothetical protein [Planctomycetaceae bacterium]
MLRLLIGLALLCSCRQTLFAGESHQWETDHFQLVLSENAVAEHFLDRRSGTDHIGTKTPFCILKLEKGGWDFPANHVERNVEHRVEHSVKHNGDLLTFSFSETPMTVKLRVTAEKSFLTFDVVEVAGGEFYSLQFAKIPLNIDDTKSDFAATAMSRKINTKTLDFPGRSRLLGGQCYRVIGYEGAGVMLLGLPEAKLRDAMKAVVDSYPPGEMPVSKAGGPYAMDNPKNRGSYIITSEPITEDQVEEWVDHLSKFGVDQVDFHQGTPFRQGDFHFNATAYPNGIADFRKTSEAFKKHGMVTGLHTYAEFLSPASRFVTPVPSKDLDVMRTFTLAEDLDGESKAIHVEESTADVSEITGFFVRNSKVVRIDDELILINRPQKEAPFGFAECTRGAYGTKVSAHAKGTPVDHLTQFFFLFAPKPESELFLEVARETAKTYNEGGFGMIYLDALDGTWSLVENKELTWYYDALFVNEILKHVGTPPLLEYSTFSPNLWYGRSRMGAWDSAHRGYQTFFDKHIATNLSSADRLYLPGQMGWLAICPSRGDNLDNFQYDTLFSEDVEYLGAKSMGHDYGLSYLDIQKSIATPATWRNGEILKNYDTLRKERYFSPETINRLQEPGKHFHLAKTGDDAWRLKEANYGHAVLTAEKTGFVYDNPFEKQVPMLIRIENRHQTLDDDAGIELIPMEETQVVDKLVSQKFEKPIDLSGHLGFGVWVFGDGGGQQINIRFDSPHHLVSGHTDHFIDVDFEGWRYFSLAKAENGTRPDVKWPISCDNIYSEFRERVHYNSISEVHLMIVGDSKNLRFRTVKALPIREDRLIDPTLEINGQTVTFTGTIKNGHFMEYVPGNRAVVYDSLGHEISEMAPSVRQIEIPCGKSTVRFSTKTESGKPAAVRITLGTIGE